MKVLFFFICLVSFSTLAMEVTGFKKNKTYQLEGLIKIMKKRSFLLINPETGNQQYLKIKNPTKLQTDVGYLACVSVESDCDLECEVTLIGKPKALGPIHQIKDFDPNANGVYADVDPKLCL